MLLFSLPAGGEAATGMDVAAGFVDTGGLMYSASGIERPFRPAVERRRIAGMSC